MFLNNNIRVVGTRELSVVSGLTRDYAFAVTRVYTEYALRYLSRVPSRSYSNAVNSDLTEN